jgi:hypothetical protein
MSSIVVAGDTSGSITIQAPAVAGSGTVLTLPTTTGTLYSTTGGGAIPVNQGGTGNTSATAYAVLTGGTTSTGAFQSIASVGTSGQILTSNGAGALPTFQTAAAGGTTIPSGTRMPFQQTAAPTGFTKDSTAAINDSILRLVTGTVSSGGSTAFSTWNAQTTSGATTLSTSQIPSHTHPITSSAYTLVQGIGGSEGSKCSNYDVAAVSGSAGSGGSHTHSLTQSLKYYDFIIASKD